MTIIFCYIFSFYEHLWIIVSMDKLCLLVGDLSESIDNLENVTNRYDGFYLLLVQKIGN